MAGRIPQSFINDLLARVDIVDVINARLTLKKAGKNYQALCPFHDEKTPSFSVSPDKQFYHCFGCGESGTALTFLMEHDHLEFVEAVENMAGLVGLEVPREEGAPRVRDNSNLYELLARAAKHFRQSLKTAPQAVGYLKSRGLTGEIARNFGIGYAPEGWDGITRALADVSENLLLEAGLLTSNDKGRVYDRFRERIMFPIRDTRGRVIGFGGRIFGDGSGPKYLNSPETPVFHKGRELYGLFEARRALRHIDRLVVVEGYMDVAALAQEGIANAVATLGTASTQDHFHKLFRHTQEVVCCFDGDSAGRKAAWRALENALPTLTEGRQLKFVFLPDGEDPDTLVRARGRPAFISLVDEARPAIEYLFERLGDGLSMQNLDDQARLASLAMPYIDRVPGGILKDLMLNRLQLLTGFIPNTAGATPVSRSRNTSPNRLSPLSKRLLTYLLKNPGLYQALPPDRRREITALEEGDLFLDVVKYLDENPEADSALLLGRWSGDAAHGELVALFERRLDLTDGAMTAEFVEGVARYVAGANSARRRRLLAEIREQPSTEKLKRFWKLKQLSNKNQGRGDDRG
ncbi:MAG: DNA primase [Gammaproteobacteria bacterium]|nr:DNA primase [Gammaproteobacteria bacterium]